MIPNNLDTLSIIYKETAPRLFDEEVLSSVFCVFQMNIFVYSGNQEKF